MRVDFRYLTIHVPNVWQTCEWYHQVFDFNAVLSADGTSARLNAAGQALFFAAHDDQDELLGPRRLNSFLSDPPALHLSLATADVPALFDHALAHGAVAVREPEALPTGQRVASIRDLNGLLILLREQGY